MPKRNRGKYLDWNERRDTWEIVWYERGRRRSRSCGTADRREAEGQLAETIVAEPSSPRDPSQRPIAQILASYMTEHAETVADPARIGYAVQRLLPFWGELCAADVKATTCKAYARQRKAGAGTVRRELGTLQAALNHDYREGRMTLPVAVTLPAKPPPRDVWLDRTQIAALIRAARKLKRAPHLPFFILIAFYTGQRKTAILQLRKPQVTCSQINFAGPTETKKRRGRVPIPRKLHTTLRYLLRRTPDLGYLFAWHGRPMADIQTSFNRAARKAGLKATPHTLRHSAATHMIRQGVSIGKVAAYLGNSPQMIEQVYGHHAPDYMDDARRAFE